ncbi:MAG: hypothetical protein IKG85_06045 [Clostridia bacterium]|nr:hypothetical protein [Clostridia bacterium]
MKLKTEKKKVVHLDPEGWARKVRLRKRAALMTVIVLAAAAAVYFLLSRCIIPASRYASAESALRRGEIAEAIAGFTSAGSWRGGLSRAAEIAFSEQGDPSIRRRLSEAEHGSIVEFGHYEQDGETADGAEPISWVVLDKRDGQLLLLSEKVLDAVPYNETECDITWAECSLRRWVNGEFLSAAFTGEERLLIITKKHLNENNSVSGAKGGASTVDTVFIPSLEDLLSAARLKRGFSIYDLSAAPTVYARSRGLEGSPYGGSSCWWTRTPGSGQSTVMYADMGGSLLHSSRPDRTNYGVRPMIWVFAGDAG